DHMARAYSQPNEENNLTNDGSREYAVIKISSETSTVNRR
ncbi:hypothetical protein GBF38_015917, partial [Nibea albiflora]